MKEKKNWTGEKNENERTGGKGGKKCVFKGGTNPSKRSPLLILNYVFG